MNHSHNNGIWSPNFEDFLPCNSLEDLGTLRVKDFVERHVLESRCFYCGCGGKDCPRKLWCRPVGGLSDPRWNMWRGNIKEHPDWCFLRRASDGMQRKVGINSRTFAPPQDSPNSTDRTTARNIGTDYTSSEFDESAFGRFCRASLAKAIFEEMFSEDSIRLPAALPLLRRWNQSFHRPTVPTGKTAQQLAAQHDCNVSVGIVENPLPFLYGNGEHQLEGRWLDDPASKAPLFESLSISAQALANIEGCTKACGHLLAPPFAVAVLNSRSSRRIKRVWAHAFWTDGRCLTPIASGYEAAKAASLAAAGAIYLKPLFAADVAEFFRLIMGRDLGYEVRYCPDFLIWDPLTGTLTIVEVRGFRPGSNPRYEADMTAKIGYFGAWPAPWRLSVVNGWDLAATSPAPAIGDWFERNLEQSAPGSDDKWFTEFKASFNSPLFR